MNLKGSTARRAVLGGVILLLIPLLCWIGALLYWDIRVGSAIREREAHVRDNPRSRHPFNFPSPNDELLFRAGCRALPQLIDAMNASKDPRFQESAMGYVQALMAGVRESYTEEEMREVRDWNSRWSFRADGPEFDRKEKLENFNAWWASNGHRYHQGWRVWSDRCHGD